jgi:hypothetical protein
MELTHILKKTLKQYNTGQVTFFFSAKGMCFLTQGQETLITNPYWLHKGHSLGST